RFDVVEIADVGPPGDRAADESGCEQDRKLVGANRRRRRDVEPELETRVRREVDGERAEVRVRIGVGHQREGGTPDAADLEGGIEAASSFGDDSKERAGELDV